MTPTDLTKREAEVLALMATGLSVNGAAQHLWISPETIRYHLKHSYRKLGVHTRADAIARVTTHGAITTRCPQCGCRRRWSPA